MLKNDYSITVETLEDTLSKINLFGMVTDTKEISDNIGHIVQNFDKYVMFTEDPEEKEVIRGKLEEIQGRYREISEDIETETFSLITLLNNLRYLADVPEEE